MKKMLIGLMLAFCVTASVSAKVAGDPPKKDVSYEMQADNPVTFDEAVTQLPAGDVVMPAVNEAGQEGLRGQEVKAPKPSPAPIDSLISNPPPDGSAWYVYASYVLNIILAVLAIFLGRKAAKKG